MRVKLPEQWDRAVVEQRLNDVLAKLEKMAQAQSEIGVAASAQQTPQDGERLPRVFRNDDGTKKIVVRDEGKNYTVDLTEVT